MRKLKIMKTLVEKHVVEKRKESELKELFIENITNIDYTHSLPVHTGKCKNIHSHSSYDIGIIVKGYKDEATGMVLDYGDIKKIVKEVVSEYDHKILIDRKYLVQENGENYQFSYTNDNGRYFLDIPKVNVVLFEGETTLENITSVIGKELNRRLPSNITSFVLIMKEGTGGGCITRFSRGKEGDLDIEFYQKRFLTSERRNVFGSSRVSLGSSFGNSSLIEKK